MHVSKAVSRKSQRTAFAWTLLNLPSFTLGPTSPNEYKMEVSDSTTLFPKITNHIPVIIQTLKHTKYLPDERDEAEEAAPPDPTPVVGIVKLHVAYVDMAVANDNVITFQPQNHTNLLPAADNFEFATTLPKNQDCS